MPSIQGCNLICTAPSLPSGRGKLFGFFSPTHHPLRGAVQLEVCSLPPAPHPSLFLCTSTSGDLACILLCIGACKTPGVLHPLLPERLWGGMNDKVIVGVFTRQRCGVSAAALNSTLMFISVWPGERSVATAFQA